METRAAYVTIGAFTIAALIGGLLFGAWLSRASFGEPRTAYDVYFETGISGIAVGSEVQFNGVHAGQVDDIAIDSKNPKRIRVQISVGPDIPIQEGATATVLPRGITGTSYIQIESADHAGPPLVAEAGQPRPVIPSEPSPVQEVLGGAPELLHETQVVLERVADVLDENNRRSFAGTLTNMQRLTKDLADQTATLQTVLPEIEKAATDVQDAAAAVEKLGNTGTAVVDDDVKPLVTDLHALVENVDRTRVALAQSMGQDVTPRLDRALDQLGDAAEAVRRVAERLEESPRDFLLGTSSVPEARLR
jgi:phospholipid/cholesterol/gamma-HCH transport system substrate-binding protein